MRYLLHDVFTKTVLSSPNQCAIIHEDGEQFSYNDLNLLSNKFANFLKEAKNNEIRKNPFVGVISPVHANSIACILGALKIGCAYIPLDEYSPKERLKHIVNSTDLDIIFIDSHLYYKHYNLFESNQIKFVVLLDNTIEIKPMKKLILFSEIQNQSSEDIPLINQVSDDLAYILHSSGSTGVPKGIMLTHSNARTFVDWMQKEFQIQKNDKVMSRAPFKFDLSVFDIFNTFNAGATLICFDWNKTRDEGNKHKEYVLLMEKEKATILYTTPSTLISLMNRGELNSEKSKLRTIMYAGEPFPVPQIRKLQETLPNTRIANIYGPTETNIITYYWVDSIPEDDTSSIPLGAVVDDTEIIVVSEDQQKICNPDEMGELWCRGGTVTIGYLGMKEKTKENLVISPFHKYPVYFWRTGDFGYRDKEGVLYYKGRKDHMVKVKGFRIEIGEVENAISRINELDEFVVVAKLDEKYGNRLYSYYSLLINKNISVEKIIEIIKQQLPEYMIPYKFIKMEALPKTSSGKVDRVLLSEKQEYEKK